MKHTHGPWRAKHKLILSPNGQLVAETINGSAWTDGSVDKRDANACLIAAAPELLEALKDMIDMCQPSDRNPDTRQSTLKAKAAISKATPQPHAEGNE